MRFVKTPEEIAAIQNIYSRCHLLGTRTLTVYFETDPDMVRQVLPPPLEPAPNPVGIGWVGEVASSNCTGPYSIAALAVRARYGEIVGNYCLTVAVSTPEAVMFGRELYGEPRKLAKMIFEEQDEHVWGSAERNEIRILSMRGRCSDPAPTGRQETSSFFFKFLPRPDGSGFDFPPQLVHVTGDVVVTEARRGRGEIVFRESPHDPVIDVPVRQVMDAVYTAGHGYTSGRILCEVDPEAFLPYAFSKIDSFEAVAEGAFLHVAAARKTKEGRGQWRKNGAGV
jgi:acetoacetate decarboxylase